MKIKLVTFLTAFIVSVALQAQTADDIITKYIATTGGADKWKALKSTQIEGKVATPQGDIPMTYYLKSPNKSKMILNFQGQEFVMTAFDGTTGWYKNPMQGGNVPQKMDEEQTKELALEEFEDEFIDYKKKGHAVTLEGKEEIDGVQCFKIKLEKNKNNDRDDITEYHYFDAENFVPILQKSYIRTGPSKGTEMQTYMSDYQEVEGLMMPFFLEQKMNGQSVGKITIEKVTLNKVEDGIFVFPQ